MEKKSSTRRLFLAASGLGSAALPVRCKSGDTAKADVTRTPLATAAVVNDAGGDEDGDPEVMATEDDAVEQIAGIEKAFGLSLPLFAAPRPPQP